jgi:hypothetical protein
MYSTSYILILVQLVQSTEKIWQFLNFPVDFALITLLNDSLQLLYHNIGNNGCCKQGLKTCWRKFRSSPFFK